MSHADYIASLSQWTEDWVQRIQAAAEQCPAGGDPGWDQLLQSLEIPIPRIDERQRLLRSGEPLRKGALPGEVRMAFEVLVDRLRPTLSQLEALVDSSADPSGWRLLSDFQRRLNTLAESELNAYLAKVRPAPATSSIFANALASTPSLASTTAPAQAMTIACPTCGSPRMSGDQSTICKSCGSALFSGGASQAVEGVLQRWSGFIAKIIDRHRALMKEAEQGCADLLQQTNLDARAMGNAWGAIHARALELRSKVENTYSSKVRDDLLNAGASQSVMNREDQRTRTLPALLEREEETMRIKIHADAARLILERARREQKTEHPCTQCGAPLAIPEGTLRAVNLSCRACSSVNTYEPGTFARMAEWYCAHPLAEEATLSDRWVMEDASQRRSMHETIETIRDEERAMWLYWRRFFHAKARIVPSSPETIDQDVRGRMRFFYEMLKNNGVWVRAGARPMEG